MNKKIKIVLGFDFGTKRIGVAIGQTVTKNARLLVTLTVKDGEPNWPALAKLINKWHPDDLVVGIPLNMDGTEQALTLKAKHFITQLKSHFATPIFTIDERLTTKDARERLF